MLNCKLGISKFICDDNGDVVTNLSRFFYQTTTMKSFSLLLIAALAYFAGVAVSDQNIILSLSDCMKGCENDYKLDKHNRCAKKCFQNVRVSILNNILKFAVET